MINYPDGKKRNPALRPAKRANLGMDLETDLNITHQQYVTLDRALVYKKPTPIQIVHVDYPSREHAKITEAYFKIPSTTDYNGIWNGLYIDFEAKQTQNRTRFSFAKIFPHQWTHLKRVAEHGGLAFVILRFTLYNETYLIYINTLLTQYNDVNTRSISYTWVKHHAYLIPCRYQMPCDWLSVVKTTYKEHTL